ncbi:MAG: four helix bundle protein [Planctomycetota bacterium]|nr:four helix bundle protein [Planctomycetota bacterium]
MAFVTASYQVTKRFPKEELYGLTSQLRRAAVSVPANIAEGHGRDTRPDYARHLSIAYGSLMEVETHLQIARNLEYVSPNDYERLLEDVAEVGRLLNALKRSLARPTKP